MGKLLTELMTLATENDKVSRNPSEWWVVMRHDLDGDVILGAHIQQVEIDGFHRQVNLRGPAPVIKKGAPLMCGKPQVYHTMHGYRVAVCNLDAGHQSKRHRYGAEVQTFPSAVEADELKQRLQDKWEEANRDR